MDFGTYHFASTPCQKDDKKVRFVVHGAKESRWKRTILTLMIPSLSYMSSHFWKWRLTLTKSTKLQPCGSSTSWQKSTQGPRWHQGEWSEQNSCECDRQRTELEIMRFSQAQKQALTKCAKLLCAKGPPFRPNVQKVGTYREFQVRTAKFYWPDHGHILLFEQACKNRRHRVTWYFSNQPP